MCVFYLMTAIVVVIAVFGMSSSNTGIDDILERDLSWKKLCYLTFVRNPEYAAQDNSPQFSH